MFHTYVRSSTGHAVDIGRAQFLFDKDLAYQTAQWLKRNGAALRAEGREPDDQAFFDHYCRLHADKHGAPFEPDVNPRWD